MLNEGDIIYLKKKQKRALKQFKNQPHTVNSGESLYDIAQMYGMELSFGQYIAIIITSTLCAVGQAGVPGPTLLVVAVLVAAGIPIEALPILFGVDRIFDMLRTAVNITGDAACACIVDQFREEEA